MPMVHIMNSPVVQFILHKYQSLDRKEQVQFKWLLGCLFVLVIVFGVVLPVLNYKHQAQLQMEQAASDLAWMKKNADKVIVLPMARSETDSLLGLASRSAKKYYINFKRYESDENDRLRINLEKVLFKNLILWLEFLDKNYNIEVKAIRLEQQGAAGYVDALLVLQG